MEALNDHLRDKTHIIWDWNGTLLDDVDLCVETICHVLEQNGLPPISRDHYRERFCFPVIEYYRGLGFDFEKIEFSIVADQFIERYKTRVKECPLHAGAKQFLETLRANGKNQSILSAAREADLVSQLKHMEIEDFFDHVYGIADHYAAGKVERGRELIKALNVPLEEIIMFGDTDHDREVAAELGIDLVLLGDGHQHVDRLRGMCVSVVESRKRLS